MAVALALVAGLAAGAALGRIAAVTAASRLARLRATAVAYAQGDYSRRLRSGSDELGEVLRPLDDAFQALAGRLTALTRDRARMEAILSGMVEGVLVMDEQGVVQLANEAARRALRVRDDPVGRRYVELVRHPDIEAQISRALRGEPTDAQELTIAQDPAQTIMAQATRVSGEGSQGVVLVLHDITGLRRADRIRRDFVANVSHELRTPLTAIRGYVEALIDLVPPDAEPRRFLDIIARHSSRMEGLVKDLLRLTRLEAGQEPLDRVAVAPAHLFDGVVHDLEPLLARRHQQITTSVAPEAAVARRRSRQAARRPPQPDRERRQLRARADDHQPLGAARRRPRRARRRGRRPGHPRGRSPARLRALLPRRQGALARDRRHRPGPVDRQAPGRAARRRRPGREPRRRRRPLHRQDPGMMWLLVGVGGALGSMARYGVNQAAALWLPAGFPFGTFIVNAVGCAIFGVMAGIGERSGVMTPALRAFCLTGVLGGLTTFSSYSYESFALARGGTWGLMLLNALGQLIVGFAAVAGGWWAARSLA